MTILKNKKCLHCGKALSNNKFKPFCSLRCKNIDLHKWLSNQYAIPESANALDASEIDEPSNEEDFS